jgi:hypothetical protein
MSIDDVRGALKSAPRVAAAPEVRDRVRVRDLNKVIIIFQITYLIERIRSGSVTVRVRVRVGARGALKNTTKIAAAHWSKIRVMVRLMVRVRIRDRIYLL